MAKYDEVTIILLDSDANRYVVVDRVINKMRQAGIGVDEINKYREAALDGSYVNMLRVTMDWVNVE